MDPESNLKEQLDIANRLIVRWDNGDGWKSVNDLASDAVRLAELVQALDEWLRRGGSFPAAWHSA